MKKDELPTAGKDSLITLALGAVAVVTSLAAGWIALSPTDHTPRKPLPAIEQQIAALRGKQIISSEHYKEGNETRVRYSYIGEPLPAKLSVDEVVGKRTPTSYTRDLGKGNDGSPKLQALVYPKPQFFNKEGTWYYQEYGVASQKAFDTVFPKAFLSSWIPVAYAKTDSAYTKASGDGDVYTSVDTTDTGYDWTTAHDSSSGYSYDTSSTIFGVGINLVQFPGPEGCDDIKVACHTYYTTQIFRGFLPFDTSSIPYGSKISSSTLILVESGSLSDSHNDTKDYFTLVQTTQNSDQGLEVGDFDQAGSVTSPTEGIDSGQRKDISSMVANTSYAMTLNSTGRSWIKTNGQQSVCSAASSGTGQIFLTSGSSWVVPPNWGGTNTIETIGGGGGGSAFNSGGVGEGGGGGGAYSKATNVSLVPGSTVTYAIGAGGGFSTAGGDTYFCNSTSNCASIAGSAVVVGAKGGSGASVGTGGAGGASGSGIGTTKVSGGTGGSAGSWGGGGGGGAGGPSGAGANGGLSSTGGGGGGGASGGAAGSAGSGSTGGAGGNGPLGSGGGAANTGGTNGGGGGGGDGTVGGGAGGDGTDWNSTHGAGAGGGGSGDNSFVYGANGGLYGGGGGGAPDDSGSGGGSGAGGIIVMSGSGFGSGITCLGIREGHDTTNTNPGTVGGTYANPYSSEQTGTSQDPVLAVTYTPPFAFWQFQDF
ncbi:MAG: Glycine-rich cell wall structural protein precursor [Parcubacteria bacterium C7867-001]|nr:MAG: Glycine-rich cell wall structural protein precursor [Parcubacteria bacterium C7867-001]